MYLLYYWLLIILQPLDNLSLGGSFTLPLVLSGGLIPGQSRDRLWDIQLNLVGGINFTDYERLVNQRAVSFDVEEVYNNLTRIATLQANMVHKLVRYATLISMFTANIFLRHDQHIGKCEQTPCTMVVEYEQLTSIVLMPLSTDNLICMYYCVMHASCCFPY